MIGILGQTSQLQTSELRDALALGLKEAMLRQDRRRVNTLRLVNAAIKDRDLAARAAGRDLLTGEEIVDLLGTMIRQRKEAASALHSDGEAELADAECEEVRIIREFLPRQLDDAEMQSVCTEAIAETGAHGLRDLGRCMATLKSRYAGKMDFSRAGQIVRNKLG